MIIVQGFCRNLEQIKNRKEKWNWLQFLEKEKMFRVVCRKHQERLKKMIGFTETFIQGSDNFKTSRLSDHDKMLW